MMTIYFLTSYDASFFLMLLMLPFLPLILCAPVYVFYRVFRSPDKRETDYKVVKAYSKWMSLICVAASLIIVALAPGRVPFEDNPATNCFFFNSLIVAALAFVFGVLSLPRLQDFAVLLVALVNYFFHLVLCVFVDLIDSKK